VNVTSLWMHEVRRRWEDRPRTPDPASWTGPAPEWIEGDGMARIFQERDAIYRAGEPAWAHILMANSHAWKPGTPVAPGTILLSHDPMIQREPELYQGVSQRFWRLKQGAATTAVGLASQIPFAQDEMGRWFRRPLARSLTSGRVVYVTGVFFWSKQVPGGCLQHNLIPVVAARGGDPPTVMVLPKVFWPTELRERWETAARNEGDDSSD